MILTKMYASAWFRSIEFCAVIVAVLSAGAYPQSGSRTIFDYYLSLPEGFFICEGSPNVTAEYKKKQIVRTNVRNGYIEATSEGSQMQVALFTDKKLKLNVVAVSIRCGEGCMCNRFALLKVDDAMKMTEVTDMLFPGHGEISKAAGGKLDDPYEFILPEFGTVIKVSDSMTGKVILNVDWSGGRFVIK